MAPALPAGSLAVTGIDGDRRRSPRLSSRWPERPLGLSSRRLVELLDVRDGTHERDAAAADSIGYMARLLIQTTLPHRNPGNVPVWTRTNGNFTLQITPGYSIATPSRPTRPLGVPFGVYPRLVFTYLTSEAVRTRSPEVFLGRSFAEFIRRLGLDVRGGERGTIGRLKDQLARLTRATIDWSYVEGNTELSEGIRPIEGSYTLLSGARRGAACHRADRRDRAIRIRTPRLIGESPGQSNQTAGERDLVAHRGRESPQTRSPPTVRRDRGPPSACGGAILLRPLALLRLRRRGGLAMRSGPPPQAIV